MMKSRIRIHWFVLSSLLTLAAVGCGDDDDDSSNIGGSSGAGRGGTASNGGNNLGGDEDPGNAGGSGNSSNAGRAGGGTSTGGTSTAMAGAGGANESGAAGAGGAEAGAGGGGSVTAELTDAQILLVLDTLNQGEVEEAYAALPRLEVADVKAFAQQMITDHGSARLSVADTADELQLNPAPSEVQVDLMHEAESHVATLRATPTAALDQAYVDLQVSMHADALALLSNLEDAADAAELRSLIATLEAAVQDHYDSALDIQAEL